MANTFEGWTQIMVFSMLFVVVLATIVIPQMNDLHGGSNSIVGLGTDNLENSFQDSQKNIENKINSGDAGIFTVIGLTLSTSWDIIASFFNMFIGFVGGTWINTIIVSYLGFPSQLAWVFRGLFIISLGFIIVRLLFKTNNI